MAVLNSGNIDAYTLYNIIFKAFDTLNLKFVDSPEVHNGVLPFGYADLPSIDTKHTNQTYVATRNAQTQSVRATVHYFGEATMLGTTLRTVENIASEIYARIICITKISYVTDPDGTIHGIINIEV